MEQQTLLRLPRVLDRVDFKKTKLWELVSTNEFPQPIKLSPRVTVWIESEVNEWINAKISEARNENV